MKLLFRKQKRTIGSYTNKKVLWSRDSPLEVLNANGKYVLGKGQVYLEPALGNDNPEGERPNATKARLAFEGATEANETASRMAKQYEKGSIQMDSALGWMSQATKDKQKFRDAVL